MRDPEAGHFLELDPSLQKLLDLSLERALSLYTSMFGSVFNAAYSWVDLGASRATPSGRKSTNCNIIVSTLRPCCEE
jgi:hypothetical protein